MRFSLFHGAWPNFKLVYAKPHSLGGGVMDMRTGGRWFDPRPGKYSFRGLMIVVATGHSSLTAVRRFDNDFVGKQQVSWEQYCAGYWL